MSTLKVTALKNPSSSANNFVLDGSGGVTITDDLVFSNRTTTDGHIQLWSGDASGGYAIGIESFTLYNRANQNHRWYINSYADGGTSAKMQLNNTGLDVPSGTIQDTTGNVRTPRYSQFTSGSAANETIANEGVYNINSTATTTTITLGAPAEGTIMCIYNQKGTSVTLAAGSTITQMRKGADNNTTHNSTLTLEPYSLTTITIVLSTRAIVTGTGVL